MPDHRDRRLDAGLLLLRIGAGGSLFVFFGLQKLGAAQAHLIDHQPWAFIAFNQKIHFPLPELTAYVETVNESVWPLLVLAGLWGRIPAGLLGIAFAVATGASVVARESFLTAATYCVVFFSLSLTGSGTFSIDQWFYRRQVARQPKSAIDHSV